MPSSAVLKIKHVPSVVSGLSLWARLWGDLRDVSRLKGSETPTHAGLAQGNGNEGKLMTSTTTRKNDGKCTLLVAKFSHSHLLEPRLVPPTLWFATDERRRLNHSVGSECRSTTAVGVKIVDVVA